MDQNILLLYAVAVTLVVLAPIIIDLLLTNSSRRKAREQWTNAITALKDRISEAQMDELIKASKDYKASPTGTLGLARTTMTVAVIVILGLAVMHILTVGLPTSLDPQGNQIVNTILTMLGSLLAAITGFYFGGRAAGTPPAGPDKDQITDAVVKRVEALLRPNPPLPNRSASNPTAPNPSPPTPPKPTP